MALFLTEADVTRLISIEAILPAVEAAFRDLGEGGAQNRPRQRAFLRRSVLMTMNAAMGSIGRTGFKAYTAGPQGARFWAMLFDEEGSLLCLMQADRLGQVRTGCASAVGAKYLARAGACTVGLIGTGWQARTQLAAVCAVRPIVEARIWSRNPAKVEAFCAEMGPLLPGVQLIPAASGEEAVRSAEIVITMTNAREPVLRGEWLSPGTTVLAAGSNQARNRELDTAAIQRMDLIVTDSVEQARMESGDLIIPVGEGALAWDRVYELGEVVAGKRPGRQSVNEINLFKSNGLAIQDVAAAQVIYERARATGVGIELPIG
jgi:alanine dehydrogenase